MALALVVPVMSAPGAHGTASGSEPEVPEGYAHLATRLADAPVSGIVRLEGTAHATAGWDAAYVQVWLDDHLVGRAYPRDDGSWSFPLETRGFVDGPHELRLCGMATPSGQAAPATFNGGGDVVTFETLNANGLVTLYEKSVRLSGASTDTWTFLVDRAYSGLRVTVTPAGALPPAGSALAQVVLTYHEPGTLDVGASQDARVAKAPTRVWIASYGPAASAWSVNERADAGIAPGGVLMLNGFFAGLAGEVVVRVDAVPPA